MAQDDLRWYGPGLGRPAAPSPHSQAERERLRAELAPANAARREAFARARSPAFEIPATVITGQLADIPAGLIGLATWPFVGADRAADNVRAVQDALTYQPRGDATYAALERAAPALQKVDDALSAPANWVADTTGSPALATAAYVAPDAISELLGAGLAMRSARNARRVAQAAERMQRPGYAILTGTQGTDWRTPANMEANANLRRELEMIDATGRGPQEVRGSYEGVDQGPSFLLDMDEDMARMIARRYNQESILTHRGLVRPDGSIMARADHSRSKFGRAARREPFFTELPGGVPYSMGLLWDD